MHDFKKESGVIPCSPISGSFPDLYWFKLRIITRSSSFSRPDATLRKQSRTSSLRPLLRMLARRDEQPLVKANEDTGYECAKRGEKPFPFPSSMRVHVIPTSKRQMALLPLVLLEKNQQQDGIENINETIALIRKTIDYFARASRIFVHFFAVFAWKCLISCFVQPQRSNDELSFLFTSELGYGPFGIQLQLRSLTFDKVGSNEQSQ